MCAGKYACMDDGMCVCVCVCTYVRMEYITFLMRSLYTGARVNTECKV